MARRGFIYSSVKIIYFYFRTRWGKLEIQSAGNYHRTAGRRFCRNKTAFTIEERFVGGYEQCLLPAIGNEKK